MGFAYLHCMAMFCWVFLLLIHQRRVPLIDSSTSTHCSPHEVIEQKPEKKVKVVVQEEAVDTSKPTDDEKTRVFPVDFERWTSKWHSAVSERKIGESWELPIFWG